LKGTEEELDWYVAEAQSFTLFRPEVLPSDRDRFIEQTRHWVMRDLRDGRQLAADHPITLARQALADVIGRFRDASIEQWNAPSGEWESLSLQALWRICVTGVRSVELPAAAPSWPVRHRDILRLATGEDSDALVHGLLIRFCAAFTDQGLAPWMLPDRELGFYHAFLALYGQPNGPPDNWVRGLDKEINRLRESRIGPVDSILESLSLLGVDIGEWEEFVPATLLALRGWAGMLWQMEVRGDRVPQPVPAGTLVEFLAVRLILERLALAYVASTGLKYAGPLHVVREFAQARLAPAVGPSVKQRAFLVFQLAQVRGWTPAALHRLAAPEWAWLLAEIEVFGELERRSLLQRKTRPPLPSPDKLFPTPKAPWRASWSAPRRPARRSPSASSATRRAASASRPIDWRRANIRSISVPSATTSPPRPRQMSPTNRPPRSISSSVRRRISPPR
jgi:hypothetical protein